MYCKKCGNEQKLGQKYCSRCGQKFPTKTFIYKIEKFLNHKTILYMSLGAVCFVLLMLFFIPVISNNQVTRMIGFTSIPKEREVYVQMKADIETQRFEKAIVSNIEANYNMYYNSAIEFQTDYITIPKGKQWVFNSVDYTGTVGISKFDGPQIIAKMRNGSKRVYDLGLLEPGEIPIFREGDVFKVWLFPYYHRYIRNNDKLVETFSVKLFFTEKDEE